MNHIHEIKVLRWSVAALFAIELARFVPAVAPAQAEPAHSSPGGPSVSNGAVVKKLAIAPPHIQPSIPPLQTHPAFALTKRPPTTAELTNRVAALEAQVDSLLTFANGLQTQVDSFYNTYRTHTHLTSLGYGTKEDYSCDASVLTLGHICTREGGSNGTFGFAVTEIGDPYFNVTDIPRPNPRH